MRATKFAAVILCLLLMYYVCDSSGKKPGKGKGTTTPKPKRKPKKPTSTIPPKLKENSLQQLLKQNTSYFMIYRTYYEGNRECTYMKVQGYTDLGEPIVSRGYRGINDKEYYILDNQTWSPVGETGRTIEEVDKINKNHKRERTIVLYQVMHTDQRHNCNIFFVRKVSYMADCELWAPATKNGAQAALGMLCDDEFRKYCGEEKHTVYSEDCTIPES